MPSKGPKRVAEIVKKGAGFIRSGKGREMGQEQTGVGCQRGSRRRLVVCGGEFEDFFGLGRELETKKAFASSWKEGIEIEAFGF